MPGLSSLIETLLRALRTPAAQNVRDDEDRLHFLDHSCAKWCGRCERGWAVLIARIRARYPESP